MWDIVAAITATLVSCTILAGIVTRYVLMPYLQKELIDPILVQLRQVVDVANDAKSQVKIVVKAWDHHQDWSQKEVNRINRELRNHDRIIKQRSGQRNKEW